MSEVLSAGGGETACRGSFGAGKRVLWCRQSIALVPGLLEGERGRDNSDKGQGVFCAVGFSACWLVGRCCWLVREIAVFN